MITPPGANVELDVETTPWGADATHNAIDDKLEVLSGIGTGVKGSITP